MNNINHKHTKYPFSTLLIKINLLKSFKYPLKFRHACLFWQNRFTNLRNWIHPNHICLYSRLLRPISGLTWLKWLGYWFWLDLTTTKPITIKDNKHARRVNECWFVKQFGKWIAGEFKVKILTPQYTYGCSFFIAEQT